MIVLSKNLEDNRDRRLGVSDLINDRYICLGKDSGFSIYIFKRSIEINDVVFVHAYS